MERDDAADSMATASTWADEIRPSRPETAPWHYVDIEIDSASYEAARDCPNDACVVGKIERDTKIIAEGAVRQSLNFLRIAACWKPQR